MIPGQKKEREWNDPPIPGETPPEAKSTIPTASPTFAGFLNKILFLDKTPVWFIIVTFVFYFNSIVLYEVVPALIRYRAPTYEINSLIWATEGWLITLLFIYFWIAYFVDYRIPHVIKTNEVYDKQPTSYKIGYFIGSIIIGFILMALFFFVMNGGKF